MLCTRMYTEPQTGGPVHVSEVFDEQHDMQ